MRDRRGARPTRLIPTERRDPFEEDCHIFQNRKAFPPWLPLNLWRSGAARAISISPRTRVTVWAMGPGSRAWRRTVGLTAAHDVNSPHGNAVTGRMRDSCREQRLISPWFSTCASGTWTVAGRTGTAALHPGAQKAPPAPGAAFFHALGGSACS